VDDTNARSLVSIVIPVYNGSDYLASAIDSALAQSYPAIEVLVVNDGSTDGGATEAIARSYGERIRYFAKPNGHVASALNFGIRQMRGTYFSWLSHDDLYKPDKIERQMSMAAKLAPDTIVYSDFETLEEPGGRVTPVQLQAAPPEHFRWFLTTANALHGCTLLVPKACLDACGEFQEKLMTTQDYDMWFRLARRYRFVHVPGVVVTSRLHAGQGTRALRDVALAECDRLLVGFARELTDGELTAATGDSLERACLALARNLRSRGFKGASAAALERALQHRPTSAGGRLRFSLEARLPGVAGVAKKLLRPAWRALAQRNVRARFTDFYERNVFGGRDSRSGEGSTLEQTATIASEIPRLVRELGVRTFLDAPCGDLNWMQHVELGVEKYIGVDIVEAVVSANWTRFMSPHREFLCRDLIVDSLPTADIVLCRDCLVHLNFQDAKKVLKNFQRSGCKYLLTTTFTAREANEDLTGNGIWRTLNLERAPFNLPPPERVIKENCTEGGGAYADKSLGLWRLEGLSLG
jgi:hypothetical protein